MKFNKKTLSLYFVAGVWNTAFGYAIYSVFTYLLGSYQIKFSYMYAYVLGNIISVTQSFLIYKYVVFKSKRNFWLEYKKCWIVYGAALTVSFALLPISVYILGVALPSNYAAFDKYLGGIVVTSIVALGSFMGHQKITFRRDKEKDYLS